MYRWHQQQHLRYVPGTTPSLVTDGLALVRTGCHAADDSTASSWSEREASDTSGFPAKSREAVRQRAASWTQLAHHCAHLRSVCHPTPSIVRDRARHAYLPYTPHVPVMDVGRALKLYVFKQTSLVVMAGGSHPAGWLIVASWRHAATIGHWRSWTSLLATCTAYSSTHMTHRCH
jgi:hypothetical protein